MYTCQKSKSTITCKDVAVGFSGVLGLFFADCVKDLRALEMNLFCKLTEVTISDNIILYKWLQIVVLNYKNRQYVYYLALTGF